MILLGLDRPACVILSLGLEKGIPLGYVIGLEHPTIALIVL